MPVGLLNTHDHIISPTVGMLGLSYSVVDSFASVVTVAYDPTFLVYDIPAVESFIVIDMEGVFRTSLGN